MKAQAAVIFEAKRRLEMIEFDLGNPNAGEVLIEIKASGVCRADAYTLDGVDSEDVFPSACRDEDDLRLDCSSGRDGDFVRLLLENS